MTETLTYYHVHFDSYSLYDITICVELTELEELVCTNEDIEEKARSILARDIQRSDACVTATTESNPRRFPLAFDPVAEREKEQAREDARDKSWDLDRFF